MILSTNPRERQQLSELLAALEKAQREFTIYFTAFCASKDIGEATFRGLTPDGVSVEVPTNG